MPSVYFISDLHLGHQKIVNFREGFGAEPEEHDAILVGRINHRVKPKDKLYVLGDCIFNDIGLEAFKKINCRHIELIIGNHDHPKYFPLFEKVHGFKDYKEFWLSHCPIHPGSLRDRVNLHGHVHHNTVPDQRFFSVCVEACNGFPLSIDEIRGQINENFCS